jgi:4-hydroxybenzoate polyprenyltransferase
VTATVVPSRTTDQSDQDPDTKIPLCIDLDGTLVRSDLLIEALFALLAKDPLAALRAPVWLLRGKAFLKAQVARRTDLDVTSLPYNERLIAYLREQRAAGRRLVLATASPMKFAQQVAEHLGFFEEVVATDGAVNLSGVHKAEALVQRFGERGFDYAGNGRPDLAVWRRTRHALLVDPAPRVAKAARRLASIEAVIENGRCGLNDYLKALRLHQWTKNLLVFIPMLAAHRAAELELLSQAMIAFLAFGLCASSVYLLNDLLDLPTDRAHPNKRMRPFAAGTVPLAHGVVLVPVLLVSAFGLSLYLPPLFAAVLALYYLSTLAYSLWLKRVVLVDVLLLAGLYTLRVLAGAAAVQIAPSFWLLAFSVFLFLSLALAKRHAELKVLLVHGSTKTQGRGYLAADLDALLSLGTAAGYMAVLVLALYINSTEINELYRRPEAIWLLCPLLLYWISRVWLGAHRGKLHDDPIVFALKDHVSRLVLVIGMAILLAATYAP